MRIDALELIGGTWDEAARHLVRALVSVFLLQRGGVSLSGDALGRRRGRGDGVHWLARESCARPDEAVLAGRVVLGVVLVRDAGAE